MYKRIAVLFLLLLLLFIGISCPVHGATRYEKQRAELVKKLGRAVDRQFVDSIFADPRCTIDSSLLVPRKGGGYGFLFTDSSVARGKRFFAERHGFIDSIVSPYRRIPAPVLAAIYRVETDFGDSLGHHVVLRTLLTRYFTRRTETKRAEEYRQLVAFLSLAREKRWDVFSVRGSSAGAFGKMQLRPTSFRYAVDGNRDGTVDVFNEHDALASAANYLVKHGWFERTWSLRRALRDYNRGGYAAAVLRYAALIGSS
jgi:membrane-bound lytic murein transglycosylase B